MKSSEYEINLKRLNELKDIDDSDERCDEFNNLHDLVVAYENDNDICIIRH